MFSVQQKRMIAENVQKILRATNHPELPQGELLALSRGVGLTFKITGP